jgi:hypothetical protein
VKEATSNCENITHHREVVDQLFRLGPVVLKGIITTVTITVFV